MRKIVSGVYALYFKGDLVYIGESSNVFLRIGQHVKENLKLFDSFEVYETFDRKRLESILIFVFDPVYNIAQRCPKYCDLDKFIEIAQDYGKRYSVKQIVNLFNGKEETP